MIERMFYRKEREDLRKERKGFSALCGFFASLAVEIDCDYDDFYDFIDDINNALKRRDQNDTNGLRPAGA